MAEVKIKKLKFFFIAICILQLFYIFHFRSGFKFEIIKNPFKENSGISFAVSSEILEMNKILKKQKIVKFNLSEEIKKDTYLYQRSIEFNYPIRVNENSPLIFFLKDEGVSASCELIETGEYLKLFKC